MNAAFLLLTTAWLAGADAPAGTAPAPAAPTAGYCGGGCGSCCNTCCDCCCEKESCLQKLMKRFHHKDCCDCCCDYGCGGCGGGEPLTAPKETIKMPKGGGTGDKVEPPTTMRVPQLEVTPVVAPETKSVEVETRIPF